ncbi:MAG: hypothetical protein FJ290_07045 [Planctomycetes bacterium]|nr:hypothetical protein [Planctomycetota bacterium]
MAAKQNTLWVHSEPGDSILTLADRLVACVTNLMRSARNEEELRIGFEKALAPLLRDLGVTRDPRYEMTVFHSAGAGRADAVHGQVVLEYEPPRAFRSKSAVEHALGQLVQNIGGAAQAGKPTLFIEDPKFVGVGFDGEQIFFVHYRGPKAKPKVELGPKDFVKTGPYPFERAAAKNLLASMRALSRRLLTAEELAQVFGPRGTIAPYVVNALEDALANWPSTPRVRAFFDEWRRLFGIVYGEGFAAHGAEEAESLRRSYGLPPKADLQGLLFCVHTYFALLMKLIAAELVSVSKTSFMSSFCHDLANSDDPALRAELESVEGGGVYAKRGVTNFLEGDFFRWYLDALSLELKNRIRDLAAALAEFEPATSTITPEAQRDLLKKLYQYLVPQEVRHDLGEYYTPDWLAELTLDEAGYDGNTLKRFLDPACGSGTFLSLAIQRARKFGEEHGEPPRETAKRILANIWGFDLNPLAVIAARTNYLFALGNLLHEVENPEIPVYLADSVLWPQRPGTLTAEDFLPVRTAVRTFHVPTLWVRNNGFLMRQAAPMVEEMTKAKYPPAEALKRLKRKGLALPGHENVVRSFYEELLELEERQENGIWARFLKNAFAPMVAGKFDYVVGNPPWIRWGYLSQDYRNATLEMWKDYGLFSLEGMAARLGGGEKDFSMLFTYAAMDFYVADKGKLAFLITQEVFKSKGAGEGFRRFQLGERAPFRVLKAHDLVQVQPFEGAANKTAILVARKGETTRYPVPYTLWRRKPRVGRIPTDASLDKAKPLLRKTRLIAHPMSGTTGSWQTMGPGQERLAPIKGENAYEARRGASVEPYGVFCLELKEAMARDRAIVRNLVEIGKRSIPGVEEVVETALLYPGVRGADIERWGCKPAIHVLLAQDPKKSSPYPAEMMRQRWPHTYSYLTRFKDILLSRGSKTVKQFAERTEFYAMFGIGPYTVARYKVVWKRMASDLVAAVASHVKTPYGFKTIIPTDTTSLIATEDEAEAHYLCAVLNSTPVRDFIKTYSSAGRGFGAPSVMQHVGIPTFASGNLVHASLAQLSRQLHDLREKDRLMEMPPLERQVDELAAQLFGLT